jgi:hypothetical protein
MIAAAPARAQQQPPQDAPKQESERSLPERFFNGVGNAVRGLFRGIFGSDDREGELTAPAPAPQQEPAADKQPEARAEPVSATPAAQVSAPQSLHSAIARGDYGAAIKMIEQGADIEAKDPGAGASAIHYAVMKGEMPLVGLLVQRGADVNSRTKSGTTPLHTAVLYRRTEIAEYLIGKGADVNAKSSSGATPLGLALAANFHTLEKMLRTHGAQ